MADTTKINDSVAGKFTDSNLIDKIKESNRTKMTPMYKAIRDNSGVFEPPVESGVDPVVDKFRSLEDDTFALDFHGGKLKKLAKSKDKDILSTAKDVISNPEEYSENIVKASRAVINGSMNELESRPATDNQFDRLLGLWDRFIASGEMPFLSGSPESNIEKFSQADVLADRDKESVQQSAIRSRYGISDDASQSIFTSAIDSVLLPAIRNPKVGARELAKESVRKKTGHTPKFNKGINY